MEVITTALGDDVDLQAGAHRGRSIDTAAFYLDISDHVGAHLQVSRLGITIPNGTLSLDLDDVGKVLCGVAKIDHTTTAIIKGPGVNAGGHLKEICPVLAALNRHSSLEFAIDIEHLSRVGNVDHRSITGYRNGFLDSTEF